MPSKENADTSKLANILKWVETKPIVLISLSDEESQGIESSFRGLEKFTIAKPHSYVEKCKSPTFCIIEFSDHCRIAVLNRTATITTLQTRLSIIGINDLTIKSLSDLTGLLDENRFRLSLERRLPQKGGIRVLSKKLNIKLLKKLYDNAEDRHSINNSAQHIKRMTPVSDRLWAQENAVSAALTVFGMDKNADPVESFTKEGSDSSFQKYNARIYEDNMVQKDAGQIPGFSLIQKDVTGKTIFEAGNERLEVYTANKLPLEEAFGVDLIYVNKTLGNIVIDREEIEWAEITTALTVEYVEV